MSSGEEEDDPKKPRGRQSALEQQKLHLTKLMANPDMVTGHWRFSSVIIQSRTVFGQSQIVTPVAALSTEKPVPIPERPKEWNPKDPPEFVRFYMGSSAGAGSEVYHVYRHLRRRELTRQQWIQEQAERDDKEREFQELLAANKATAEERTAKKRAKRLKRKNRRKEKKKLAKGSEAQEQSHSESEEEEEHFIIKGR